MAALTAAGQGLPAVRAAGVHRAIMVRCSPEEYVRHLDAIRDAVARCAAKPGAESCDPTLVGPDNEIITAAGVRQVHFDWAREALALGRANNAEAPEQLKEAEARISGEVGVGAQPNAGESQQAAQLHGRLDAVLARREFRRTQEDPGLLARAQAAFLKWLFEQFSKLLSFGGSNRWLGRTLEVAAVSVPGVLLLVWVMRRVWRPQPTLAPREVPITAPSARAWQRWLEDADGCARKGQWREAVHAVYWAAISRLEASGLWPVDRARTPREYLRLLREDHALRGDLRELTRTFERIWYGHRPAEETEYRAARVLMERMAPR